jgi:hypothetical protein
MNRIEDKMFIYESQLMMFHYQRPLSRLLSQFCVKLTKQRNFPLGCAAHFRLFTYCLSLKLEFHLKVSVWLTWLRTRRHPNGRMLFQAK